MPARFAAIQKCIFASTLLLSLVLLANVSFGASLPYTPIGDTLTVIMRPILTFPEIVTRNDTVNIECLASNATTGWTASLGFRQLSFPLNIVSTEYVSSLSRWKIKGIVPGNIPFELYDLTVTASGGIWDMTRHAVQVISGFDSNFYFLHVTDTHVPTHLYYYQSGADTDSSELVDLREVIKDSNLINPIFLIHTGDIVNEGECEDFEYRRYFTRAQKLLAESDVPVFLTAGNHDIGGWDATPVAQGEARRLWWKFFGWPYLNNPPAVDSHSNNYSFDYGTCHFTALESYINYDMWRSATYGSQSYTTEQLNWLSADLAKASGSQVHILFHHMDFSTQLNLASLGINLALYGHIHQDKGALTGSPLNIATNSCCDGKRAYRMVRVTGTTITPKATFAAGSTGSNLSVSYSPANDGTASHITATITNNINERFERGLVKFYMKNDGSSYAVTNGNLIQTVQSDSVVICYVNVDILASSSRNVSVDAVVGVEDQPDATPSVLVAVSCFPNPFQAGTNIRFSMTRTGPVDLAVFDARGNLVKRLVSEELAAGMHTYSWDATDGSMNPVSSGIYFCRVEVEGRSITSKLMVVR